MNDSSQEARGKELENLYAQLAQSATRLMVVHEASQILRSSNDPEELAEKLLSVIAEATFAGSGCVASLTDDELRILATRGMEDHEADSLAEDEAEAGVWFHVADATETRIRDDLVADLELGEDEDALAEDPDDPPAATRSGAPHFDLYLPLRVEDKVLGVLALGRRVDGKEYGNEETRLAESLTAHLALALDHAALFAERTERIEQLSVLLQISKEITSTLDMERVLSTIAHMTSMVLPNLRTVVALALDGSPSIRASSDPTFVPEQAKNDPLLPALQWAVAGRQSINTSQSELESDEDADGRDLLLPFLSREGGPRSLALVPLEDDQGILGMLAIESEADDPPLDPEREELTTILANQTTVAIRNAELYQQIPMAGMFRPLMGKGTAGGRRKLLVRAAVTAVLLGLGFLVPLPAWVSGDTSLRPANLTPVRAATQGSLAEVHVAEGSRVNAGELLATLRPDELRVQVEQVRAASQKARSEAASARMRGDLAVYRAQQAKVGELLETEDFLIGELDRTTLRAPMDGVVLTPDLHLLLGDWLPRGQTLLVLADLSAMEAHVAVPEEDVHRLVEGGKARFKVHSYPGRTFHGEVARIAPAADADGTFRVTVLVANEDEALRPGMTGRAHLNTPAQPILTTWLRGWGRALRLKFWF